MEQIYVESNLITDFDELKKDQYNLVAGKYADIFLKFNQNSIDAYFKQFDMDLKGLNVIDLGCGEGHDLIKFKSLGATIQGMDASEEMVKLASLKNPESIIKTGDFDNIPFPDNTFDLVVSKWALQTAESIEPVYKEIVRILKPNGKLVYLACHPIRQFIEKKRKMKNYFIKEMVTSTFFNGTVTAIEPSHTFNEYLSKYFFDHFTLHHFEEGFDEGAEKIDNDIYPSYFIIKADLKTK